MLVKDISATAAHDPETEKRNLTPKKKKKEKVLFFGNAQQRLIK